MGSDDARGDVLVDVGVLAAGKAREELIGRVWPRCKCSHELCQCGPAQMVWPSNAPASFNFDVTDTPCRCVEMHLYAVADDCVNGVDMYTDCLQPLETACVKPGLLGVATGPCSVSQVLAKLDRAGHAPLLVPKRTRVVSVHPSEGPLVDGVPSVRSGQHFRVALPAVEWQGKHVQLSSQDPVKQAASLSLPLAKLRLIQSRTRGPTETQPGRSTVVPVVLFHVPAIKCTSCTSRIYRSLKKMGLAPSKECFASTATKEVAAIVPKGETPSDFAGRVAATLTALDLPPEPRTAPAKLATLSLAGMSCGNCVKAVKKALAPMDVEVSLADAAVRRVPLDAVDAALEKLNTMSSKKYTAALQDIEEAGVVPVPTVVDVVVSTWDQRVEAMMVPELVREGSNLALGALSPAPSPDSTPNVAIEVDAKAAVSATVTSHFGVRGMTCSSCVARIEDALLELPGVASATVVLGTESAKVLHVESLSAEMIAAYCSDDLGYPTTVVEEGHGNDDLKARLSKADAVATLRRNAIAALSLAAPLVVLMLLAPHVGWAMDLMMYPVYPGVTFGLFFQLLLSTPAVFVYARPFFVNGWTALSHGSFTMDVLVMLGVGTAYASGWLYLCFGVGNPAADTAAVLTGFMLLGRYMETLAKSRTADVLKSLLELRPPMALLVSGHEDLPVHVPADSIKKGDVIRVAAGDCVPVDGVVSKGNLEINQSMLTGESIPVHKDVGDGVTGGTVVEGGFGDITATHVGADSTLSQIIKLISDAQGSKAPIQKMADQIAGRFVPLVLTLAAGSFVAWVVLGALGLYPAEWRGESSVFAFALNFLLATLVVACPCAMGLATPTAVMVATGVGAELGIFIKGAESLEGAAMVRAVLFDKTGTLTTGDITVQGAEFFGKKAKDKLNHLLMVAAAEDGTRHPIATAVANYCRTEAGRVPQDFVVANHATAPGHGIHCTIGDRKVVVGNSKWVLSTSTHVNVTSAVRRWEADGMTVVLAAVDGEVVWGFGLRDTLKPEAPAVVHHLQKGGVKVCIVTGDNRSAALAVAKRVGVAPENVFAEVLPGDKAATVQEVQAQGHKTAFVGDGINDAPALAAADIGVALGSGTKVAIESADVVLTKSNLEDVPCLLALSRTTLNRIRLNFCWAFGYNTLALPVACGLTFPVTGQLPPVLGGMAMVMSSLLVLASSLLLRTFHPPPIKPVPADAAAPLMRHAGPASYGAC